MRLNPRVYSFCLSILFLLPTTAIGQKVKVLDAITLQPIEYANLTNLNTQETIITNQQGEADLSQFDTKPNKLAVTHIGYEMRVIPADSIPPVIRLKPSTFSLDDIVISANRWEQDLSEVPNRILAVSKANINFYQPQTAADMLSQSGAVYVQKSQFGGGSPMIRGFATNRLLMVVDGVRMNTAIFRSGNIQNVLSIDPASLEGVEVVFGPGSLLYGSDAIGGVMDFHYTTPEFSQDSSMLVEGDAFVRYATVNEEKTGHINFKLGGEKWASYSSIGYTDVNELRMGSVGPDSYLRNEYVISQNGQDTVITNPDPELQVPSGMQLGSFVQKFRWKPASAWDVQAGIYYSGTSNYDRYDRLIEYRNDLPRSAEWYYGPQTWGMARASILHEGNNKVYDIARLTIAVQQFGESRNDRSFQSSSLRTRTEGVNAYSANLDLRKGDSTFSWLYGLESVLNTISSAGSSLNLSNSTTSDVSTRYPDGSTWQSHAVYISNKWKPTNDLTVQSGLRYNLVNLSANFDTTFFPLPFIKTSLSNGALTGSLGLAWIASPKWQFNLNAATGFRSPNIDDIGKIFDSEPGNVVVPNPDLEPEYVYSIDAGVRYKNAVFDLQLNGFYAILTNAIVRRDYQLDGQDSILYDGTLSQVQALQNTDRANVYGIEAALNYQINRFFSIRTQVTITEGEEQSVDASGPAIPLRHAPPAFGAVHGLFQIDRFKADLFWMWNAEVPFEELAPTEIDKDYLYAADSNGNPYSPAWSTLNIQLSYQLNTWLNISAGVENITDVRYRTYSSGIVAPGRNYIVSLRSSF